MPLQIERMSLDEIKTYPNNAKIHTAEQIEQIKESIRSFGFNDPIAIWHNEIVEGHGRFIAAQELGFKEIDVIRLDELSDEQRRAYMLVHNKLTMNTGFDMELLEFELENISMDMEQFGFDDIESDFGDTSYDEEDEEEEETEFPYFSSEEIQASIVKNWKETTLQEFVGYAMDEATAMYQFNRLCLGKRDGYNISLLFNPHRLEVATKNNGKSIFEGFNSDQKYREQFARFLVDVQGKCVTENQYYRFIGIGTAGYQYVNEFQPYVAREIYSRYCSDGSKILNPCAGWGGRLLGLASLQLKDIEYVETDPSQKTYEGLLKMKQWLNLDSDQYKTFNEPFENLKLKENYFDFVFTSPPYFDTEIYADEETQAYKTADSYKNWKTAWYFPMIDKILSVMKVGATCILNVGNARYPMEKDAKEYLREKYDIDCFTMDDKFIGGSGIGDRAGENGEPFLVFEKH